MQQQAMRNLAELTANEGTAKARIEKLTEQISPTKFETLAKTTPKKALMERVLAVVKLQKAGVESKPAAPFEPLILPEVMPRLMAAEAEDPITRKAEIYARLTDEPLTFLPEVTNQGLIQTETEPIQPAELGLNWAVELTKEPSEIYEDFVVALSAMVELFESSDEINVFDRQLNNGVEIDEQQVLPPIIVTLAERMSELEPAEKELLAPIVQNIVGAVHGIQLLEARAANSEAVTAVEIQLRELCVTLFKTLRIEYSEQDIAQFMSVLLHRPQPVGEAAQIHVNLEREGMHNAKSFADFPFYVSGVSQPLHHIIGIFTLLSAITSRQTRLNAA